jgi:hypothetical protein
MSLLLNYLLAISISGVIVLSILSILCFLDIELFRLNDKAFIRGIEMLICVLVKYS